MPGCCKCYVFTATLRVYWILVVHRLSSVICISHCKYATGQFSIKNWLFWNYVYSPNGIIVTSKICFYYISCRTTIPRHTELHLNEKVLTETEIDRTVTLLTGRGSSIGSVFARMQAAPSSIPMSGTFFRGDLVMKNYFYGHSSQQSIARKNSSDGKIEYIMASMLKILLDVW